MDSGRCTAAVGKNRIIINYGPKYKNKRVAPNIDNSETVGLYRYSEVENDQGHISVASL